MVRFNTEAPSLSNSTKIALLLGSKFSFIFRDIGYNFLINLKLNFFLKVSKIYFKEMCLISNLIEINEAVIQYLIFF